MTPIRVLLADNKEIFRKGLVKLLENQTHIEVVCQCNSGREAIEKAKETKPDVALIDINMPDRGGIEALMQINESLPDTKIVMLSDIEDEDQLSLAMQEGASAYLLKEIGLESLVKSIDLISEGEVIISPLLTGKIIREIKSLKLKEETKHTDIDADLSDREIEILSLVSKGATNKEIAKSLMIAENTVKVHVKNVLEKLRLKNKQQAAAYASQHGLLPPSETTTQADL